jgi:hypothetical protein
MLAAARGYLLQLNSSIAGYLRVWGVALAA